MTPNTPSSATSGSGLTSDARLKSLLAWLKTLNQFTLDLTSIAPASNDASFRRYFRLKAEILGTVVVMDAPPPMEDVEPFVRIDQLLEAKGVAVPRVLAQDRQQGFLLLTDLGNETFLQALQNDNKADGLYSQAIDTLITLQLNSEPQVLPHYDEALLRRELGLFPEWYLSKHKQMSLSDRDLAVINNAFDLIVENNLAQPRVHVHRDYHSRNLMVLEASSIELTNKIFPNSVKNHGLGVLDFQDAVYGPITYDLVSLLRDAYVAWPEASQLDWAIRYWGKARDAALPVSADFGEFYRDFEWMGLQRHLKVLGIFARLNYRDGKARYLSDIPLVLDYTLKAARRYRNLEPFAQWLETVEERSATTGYTF